MAGKNAQPVQGILIDDAKPVAAPVAGAGPPGLQRDISSSSRQQGIEANYESAKPPGHRLDTPDPDFLKLPQDPRKSAKKSQAIGLIGFYYPDKPEKWDEACKAGFCGNFWDLGKDGLDLQNDKKMVRVKYMNAEAAFQSLKFFDKAQQFSNISGDQAFQLKKQLEASGVKPDFTYGGYGNNWLGMLAVLHAKFVKGTPLANALLATKDAYLLEHNSKEGRDFIWSDNFKGDGTNWLGTQLMLIRDELNGKSKDSKSWTAYIEQHLDMTNGAPKDDNLRQAWQKVVQSAADILNDKFPPPTPADCFRPSCTKPSWNGRPNEFCSKSCANDPKECMKRGCNKPPYNNQWGEFCSKTCREEYVLAAQQQDQHGPAGGGQPDSSQKGSGKGKGKGSGKGGQSFCCTVL